jgi:multiple sugar transport system permease protein
VNRLRAALLLTTLVLALPVAAAEKVRLVVWGLQSGKETAGLDAQIATFEKENPDIDVSNLAMGAGNMNPQKLMTAIVGGVPPDVINQDRFTVGDWASRETFTPLDDFLADESGPDAVRRENFYDAAWKEAEYRGKVYAIPSGIDDRMLMYNRKLFREAGLDPNRPPKTWEELKDYALKLTKKNPDGTFAQIGFIPNFGNSWFYLYSWQNGGDFLSADARNCTLLTPENIGALSYMKEVYDALGGYSKVNIFQSGFQAGELDPFFTGKVAMVVHGSWMIPNVARYAPDLDFAVAPPPVPAARLRGEGRFAGQTPYVTWTGGFSLAIPRGAKHPREAWRFVRFLLSERGYRIFNEAQREYNKKIGRPFVFNLTPQKPVNEMLLRDFAPLSPRLKEAQAAYIDALSYARYRPVTFVGQKLWDAHVRAFERACQGAQSPEEALKEQQALVQKELDVTFEREKLSIFPLTQWLWGAGGLLALGLCVGAGKVLGLTARSRMARREALAGYLMAAPWILGFLIFTAGPIVASALLAFTDYDVLHPPRSVGLGNFKTLVTDDRELMGKAIFNAFYLSMYGIPLGMVTGLAIAMLLNQKVRGMHWYRTAFYIPSIVPAIASAVLWNWLLAGDPNKGLLNALWKQTLTSWFGILPPGWFGVPEWAKPGLIFQGLWGAGGGMILWLAGLQGIPQSLYEAAEIDGAGRWSKFKNVTLPMLSPYLFFNLIMGTIGALQEFDRVYVIAGGEGGSGPLDSMLVPVLYLFNNAFRYFKMGYASAIAWVLFVIILVLTLVQWRIQKYWVHYEVDRK